MARPQAPLPEAITKAEAILAKFKASGLTRREYGEREGISLSMLDYYQRRIRELQQRQGREKPEAPAAEPKTQKLLRVRVGKSDPDPRRNINRPATPERCGFTLILSKGRKIESGWDYREQDLARLIRIVEAA